MRTKMSVLLASVAVVGATWAFTASAKPAPKTNCCEQGLECCFPGSPCCDTDCVPTIHPCWSYLLPISPHTHRSIAMSPKRTRPNEDDNIASTARAAGRGLPPSM